MFRKLFLCMAVSFVTSLGSIAPGAARAGEEYRISGPFVYENLAIYLVHGRSVGGPVPLTLEDALIKNAVRVHETGNVNELTIENIGSEEVFVQSGDIVKGGKQDRVLTVSLILRPHSGRVPIASFCVEQGRWSVRGKEDVRKFSSAAAALPSRKAKIAIRAPSPSRDEGPAPAATGARQQAVWNDVARI